MKRTTTTLGMFLGMIYIGLISAEGGRIEDLKRELGFIQGPSQKATVRKEAVEAERKQEYNVKKAQASLAFNVDELVKGLRGIEKRAPESYIPFYLTVPREVVLKNKMASFLANVLKKKGNKHVIDEQIQKPLLNYLAHVAEGKPVLAEFRPRKLVDKKSKKPRLMRQEVFGPLKELNAKDFSTIASYNPAALDDLLKLANSRIRDNAGGQMLLQLFIPKDKVDTIAQARLKGEQYAIDQLMQSGPDLNKRLVNAKALLYLQPDADYTFVKLMTHDLTPKEERVKLNKQMGELLVRVADQVTHAAQHPPEPLPRDVQKQERVDASSPLAQRDHEPYKTPEVSSDTSVTAQKSIISQPIKPDVSKVSQAQLVGQKKSSDTVKAPAKKSKKEPISLSVETLAEWTARKRKNELETVQPMQVEPAFDKETLLARLLGKEKQAVPHGYVPLYFAVPREIVLKKSIMSFLDKRLRDLGHDKIINQMYQYPLLNYIAFRAQYKPISVQTKPENLTLKSMLSRQGEFGSFKKFGIDDFADIKKYNPASLSELIGVANSRIDDNAGGQMLAQLFIPKNALNKVLSRGKLSLKPNINYANFRLFTSDLQSPQTINAQNKRMGALIQQVAKQVSDAIKKPVAKTQPAKKTSISKKAPGGLLGEIQTGKKLRKAEIKKYTPSSEPKSLIELGLAKKFGKVRQLEEEDDMDIDYNDDAMDIDTSVPLSQQLTKSSVPTLPEPPKAIKARSFAKKAASPPSRGGLLAQIQAGKKLKQVDSKEVQAQQQPTAGRGSALEVLAERIAGFTQVDDDDAMDVDSDGDDDGWSDDDEDWN